MQSEPIKDINNNNKLIVKTHGASGFSWQYNQLLLHSESKREIESILLDLKHINVTLGIFPSCLYGRETPPTATLTPEPPAGAAT